MGKVLSKLMGSHVETDFEEKIMPIVAPKREIKSIKTNWSIEKTTGHGKGIGDHEKKDKEDNIKKGKANAGWGNKIHVDHTPVLSDGHVMQGNNTGDPKNDDPAWKEVPKIDDMYISTTYELDGTPNHEWVDFGSLDDNYGCTPSLKVNKRYEDRQEHVLTFRGHYGDGVKGPECKVTIS